MTKHQMLLNKKLYVYVYPITYRKENKPKNPYLQDFIRALEPDVTVINRNAPSNKGIFDILKYLRKLDAIFINWIENLPDKKGGVLQSFLYLFILLFLKVNKAKIVFTLHNKFSHVYKNKLLKKIVFDLTIRYADSIITHASEGKQFLLKNYNYTKNVVVHPHPIKSRIDESNLDSKISKEYDILIWGSIMPYKGIDKFLKFLTDNGFAENYKILIIGKASSIQYYNKLIKYQNEKIKVCNRFISDAELKDVIYKSRIVLFTYAKESVLSSGALMDSLSYGARVVGPSVAAFNDLADKKLIEVYNDFFELIEIVEKQPEKYLNESLREFIQENNWSAFSNVIKSEILYST